jgi:hypothetical protein
VYSNKLSLAIEDFGSFKFFQEDGIFSVLLKNRIETLSGQLLKILSDCVALGYIPEAGQRVTF